jgi:threonine dehydratase
MTWPITIDEVVAARERIRGWLTPTALRRYAPLDAQIGQGISVFVKHENHNPTNAFKVRNALSVLTRLSEEERRRGVIAATRGNHGQGLAWAGALLGMPVTICVPLGNSPEKNQAVRGFGARLVERGRDYDEAVEVARQIADSDGLRIVHSTNDRDVIAGAGTLTLELLEQAPEVDALVLAVGGGSQAVGALTVTRALRPEVSVYGVQAECASAIHDSWHAGQPRSTPAANTFADGLATRHAYELTFDALRQGLAGFVAVSERELAAAIRMLLRTTHNLAEGAGAAGLAGLLRLRNELAGRRVAIVISGSNIDVSTLRRVLDESAWHDS